MKTSKKYARFFALSLLLFFCFVQIFVFGKRTRERLSLFRATRYKVCLDDFPTSRRTLFGIAASAAFRSISREEEEEDVQQRRRLF